MMAFLEEHVAKIGIGGTLGTVTLGEWNLIAGLVVAGLTGLCLLPVAISRWRRLLKGRDVNSE